MRRKEGTVLVLFRTRLQQHDASFFLLLLAEHRREGRRRRPPLRCLRATAPSSPRVSLPSTKQGGVVRAGALSAISTSDAAARNHSRALPLVVVAVTRIPRKDERGCRWVLFLAATTAAMIAATIAALLLGQTEGVGERHPDTHARPSVTTAAVSVARGCVQKRIVTPQNPKGKVVWSFRDSLLGSILLFPGYVVCVSS